MRILTLGLLLIISRYTGTMMFAQSMHHCDIKWDNWGVPHIQGETDEEVYYGFGWAQMSAHGDLILKAYGQSRGRSAEYWGGAQNVQSDQMVRKINIPRRAQQWFEAQNDDMKQLLTAFVAGMNDYCKKYPETLSEELRVVLPIELSDPLARLQLSYHLKVGAFSMQPQAAQWKNAGSNAWAIAPQKSESGNCILMMQPHPPWMDDYLFFEAHLNSNDLNIYGITIPGSPSIAMGFNDHLGWGLTFNQADAMDLIELEIKDNHYLVDGAWKALEIRKEVMKVREGAGFVEQEIAIKKSDFGFIIEEKDGKALALRLSGLNRPYFTQQFVAMAKSKNLDEFEKAMSMLQLPLQNIIYADKHHEIFYLYNGIIPKRPEGSLKEWSGIIPSSRPGTLVKDYVSYDNLPKIKNPASGFVANSNNGPWSSTYPFVKEPKDYSPYIANKTGENFDLRSTKSIKMILSKPKLSFDDVTKMQSSTHSELADRTLDELIDYAEKSNDTLLNQTALVFKKWDRKLDTQSKGAVLFNQWYRMTKGMNVFMVQFDEKDALNTPQTLSEEAKEKLLDAAQATIKKYGQLDVSWGDVYKINYAQKSYDGGLGLSELGCFNAGFYRPISPTTYTLLGGSSYTSVVEFGENIQAKGLLSYGNASQNNSPFKGDQIGLLLSRQLRDIWFYKDQIDAHLRLKESLDF
ncbi:MAG: penicillin acylase family protein [Chitinophagales bacterium]|nr:penicillin acylase family protein [Chitinophagales bacterium]